MKPNEASNLPPLEDETATRQCGPALGTLETFGATFEAIVIACTEVPGGILALERNHLQWLLKQRSGKSSVVLHDAHHMGLSAGHHTRLLLYCVSSTDTDLWY